MNAQEAIEVVEQLDVFHEKNHKAIEALSIVLESAKLLHSGEPEEGPHYYYFDGWHVRKDVLPKIGFYPEGADE